MRDGRIVGTVLGVGAIVGAVVLLTRKASAATRGSPRERPSALPPPHLPPVVPAAPGGSLYGHGGSIDPDYPPAIWFPIVSALIATDYKRVDPRIAMKWLAMESDGAPCAFGLKNQFGPDGQPRELGLGQIFNPDDFKSLGLTARGITPSTFRAYCAPNTQQRTRMLSSKEMEDLARYTLLALIDLGMAAADRAVAKYGLQWPTADYWKIVKASHALPIILSQGLPAVVKKLGRAPTSWAEFRQALGMEKDARWRRSLDNAEKLASAVADVGSA